MCVGVAGSGAGAEVGAAAPGKTLSPGSQGRICPREAK